MDYKVFSLLFGALAGVVAWLFLRAVDPGNAVWAFPVGVGFTVIFALIIQILLHFEEKRYRRAEAQFPGKPVFVCEGAVYVDAGTRGARLYLFEDSVAVLGLDRKPRLELTMKLSEIREVTRGLTRSGAIVHLYGIDEGSEIHFFSRDGEQAADVLTSAVNRAKGADDTREEMDEDI